MVRKQALGKGLSALLPDSTNFEQASTGEKVRLLPLADLHANPNQPRKLFDGVKLAELAESIQQYGVMQPLIVVLDPEGGYRIVAGERRFRAAQLTALHDVPCIVRKLEEKQLAELSLLENIQREDLSPLEEAAAYRDLMESHGYTQEILSERLGKSRSHLANTLRLLNLAPQERKLLEEGKISAGHARAVLSLSDPRKRADLISAILKQGLSVRQAEDLAARMKEKKSVKKAQKQRKDLLHADIAHAFSSQLGVKVRLEGRENRGRVVIDYNSEDDLQNIIDAILGK